MKKLLYNSFVGCAILLSSCDKRNDGLVLPNVDENFPQIVLLADEGDGELEDEDKFGVVITLAERPDPAGEELSGKIVPLAQDITVHFQLDDLQGFDRVADYVLGAKAFYEVDDCTTSEDLDLNLELVFDPTTGRGSVTFPAGVEEIELEFETDADLFDDEVLNSEERGLTVRLTQVDAANEKVVINTHNVFKYRVLDDEAIYGEYELAIDDPAQFGHYLELFGLINADVAKLAEGDVEEILVEFKYGEFSTIIVLKETEEVTECGETETVNKEIEIEADLEDIEDAGLSGDLEIVGDVELANGAEQEFTYKGKFNLQNGLLSLTLQGEFGDTKTAEMTLQLKK